MSEPMSRDEMYDEIAYLTVKLKCSMGELAEIIWQYTPKEVDPESDDLLATLTDGEILTVLDELRMLSK